MNKGIINFNASEKRLSELVTNLCTVRDCDELMIGLSKWATPFAVLPICALAKKLGKKIEAPINTSIDSYLNTINFPDGVERITFYPHKSYLPITRVDFPTPVQNLNDIAAQYVKLILSDFDREVEVDVRASLDLAFSEMTTNVAEHAGASHYWLFAQKWHQERKLEFCLIDDGIGMRHRFLEVGMAVSSDVEAITEATQGRSSKRIGSELPGDRGHGLKTTIKLLTGQDFQGTFVVLSGNAAYLKIQDQKADIFEIPSFSWPGVIIFARTKIPEAKFDFYRYID